METNDEIKIGYVKEELIEVVEGYISENCDKKSKPKNSNLEKKIKQNLKDLEKKMKQEDLVIFNSDKTRHFTLNTKKNYVESMDKHLEKDNQVKLL